MKGRRRNLKREVNAPLSLYANELNVGEKKSSAYFYCTFDSKIPYNASDFFLN